MGWSPDTDTSLRDNVVFLSKNSEYELVTRYWHQLEWQRGVSLQKHWIWHGHPILTQVSETTWSFSPKTLNMGWSADSETSFSDNVVFLCQNTEYGVVNRYWDQFEGQRGVSLQKLWIWAGHPIVTPIWVTTWSVSPKTLNMGWSPDIDSSLSDNVEFHSKNTEYGLVTRYWP